MKTLSILSLFLFNVVVTPCHAILPLARSDIPDVAYTGCYVQRVKDGDTFVCADGQIIRLSGIDAPEKKQPFGMVAKDTLERLILEKYIKVMSENTDIYGRTVATVYSDTQNINLTMVQSGYAWGYPQYDKKRLYTQAQEEAKTNKRGLWKEEAIAPWEWRHSKKEEQSVTHY